MELRERICKQCKVLFFICKSCDRGHRYCTKECSIQARKASQRRARNKHRQSAEGKADHRDQESQRRAALRSRVIARVGDQGSIILGMLAESSSMQTLSIKNPNIFPIRQIQRRCCSVCGRGFDHLTQERLC